MDKEQAFSSFYAAASSELATDLLNSWLASAVGDGSISEDEVAECKESMGAGAEIDVTFTGHSENVEPCLFQGGGEQRPGCEVLESNTEFTVTIPAGDANALATICACLEANFWNSTGGLDFMEESLSDESSEFYYLGADGTRQSGEPEASNGEYMEPEHSGDGESVYYARSFASAAEFSSWDGIPGVAASVPCVWILALLANVQWSDLAGFDSGGHQREIDGLIQGAFTYYE